MSGHSKWSGIKHKKAIEDAKKGKTFTKLARQIYVAVRQFGSGDPGKNFALRAALDEAKTMNMPSDNVRRAIDKALGISDGKNSNEEVVYEGYGPGGVGIMVTITTDNKNRSGSEIRGMFEKAGGSLGGPGSVGYLRSINPPVFVNLSGNDLVACINLLSALEEFEETVEVWSNLKQ